MRNTLKDFKARALARPDVRRKYEGLREEFEALDKILKARAEAGVTQAELADGKALPVYRNSEAVCLGTGVSTPTPFSERAGFHRSWAENV